MKRTIVLILLMICGMATMKGQNPFGSHTTNTLFPNEDAKAIIQNKGKNWKCYGARHFDAKSGKYHCIVDTTYLESAVFAGRPYKNLEISINFYVENNARIYHIELINTETGETQLLKTEWKGQAGEKRFTYRLEDIDSDSLKIKIQNTAKDGTGSHAYIGSISVSGTPREPAPLIVCDTLDISISQTDSTYDRAIVQLLAVKNTRQDIDTLYYNDFSTDDLKGAEAQGSYKIGIGSYPATGRIFFDQTSDEPVALTIPLQIAGTSNEFHVEFQTRRLDIGTDSTDIRLALRDNLVATIGKKTLRETLTQHKHTIPAREIYSDLIFSVGEKGIKSCNNLFLSQLLVYQKSRYKYTPLSGFPRTTDGDMKIEGLEPNTNYVLAIQYVRESNEHGERVVTPVREYHLTTQGKYAEILPGETLELSADFKGSIALHDGGQLRGNHTILGELCYVKKYTPDVWQSLYLPFQPNMVGAFVEGAPIYLRENVDYHLHSYAADDGKYRFAKQDSLVGGKGYLLKVPSDVSDFDNHTLYIYSDKGTSVNGEKAENGQALFEHTGNPRTHDISSKESITKTGILYQFDGEAFYRYKEGSVIAPFESVVCYNGEADKAPQRIDLIPDGLPHTHAAYTISLLDGRLRITGYQGEVGIYDTAGMLLRTATSDGTIEIQLPRKNLYLIDLGGKELLKVRPQ